jgi:hypothetical protein
MADVSLPDVKNNFKIMTNHVARRQKRSLSLHQKQIRFFIGLSVGICALLAIVFFWLVSRSSFIPH